jgi:hypothetical protein
MWELWDHKVLALLKIFFPGKEYLMTKKFYKLSSSYYGDSIPDIMCPGFNSFINSVCIQNKQDKEQQSTAGELQ